MIENHIVYSFDSAPAATRFLNVIKSGEIRDIKVGLCRGGYAVKVRYKVAQDINGGFDSTCQQLDDLAARLGGQEVD